MTNLKCPNCGSYNTGMTRNNGEHIDGQLAFLFTLVTFGFGIVIFVPMWLINRSKDWYQRGHYCHNCKYTWLV